MFKNIRRITLVSLAALALTACGEKVEVPPAFKGKVLSESGFLPESYPPSKFRLSPCMMYCDRLVLVETADVGAQEQFDLFMPKDQLSMPFAIRFTYSIRSDDKWLDTIVAAVPAKTSESGQQFISAEQIYIRYGAPAMRSVVLEVLSQYTINDVASSRQMVNSKIVEAITRAFENTPILIKNVALDNVQFPEIITQQKIIAAQRRIDIEKEEAEQQVQLVKIETELEVAKANRAVRREQAEAAREENEIYAASISDKYLEYRQLEILEALAKSGSSTFVPYGALDTLGLSNRIFSTDSPSSTNQVTTTPATQGTTR